MAARRRTLHIFGAGLLLCTVMASYWGYVKDDAWISFRYARHLVQGQGLVFNPGEWVEGYSNFLWTLFGALPQLVGVGPLVPAKLLAAVSALAVLALMPQLRGLLGTPDDAPPAAIWLWASSTSVALWAMSGLEPVWVALCWTLAVIGALTPTRRGLGLCALGSVGACLTRPEGHAVLLWAALLLGWQVLRGQRTPRAWLATVGASTLVLGPYHLLRWWLFGGLLPNTWLVKGVGGPEVLPAGIENLGALLVFQGWGLWILLALWAAVAAGPKREARIWSAVFVAFWVAYQVRIGHDEMKYHRLFLPALPITLALAEHSLASLARRWRHPVLALITLACLGSVGFSLTHRKQASYRALSAHSYQPLADYLEAHYLPGDAAVFQDMGATPWYAPRVRFIDSIGVVSRPMAQLLASYRLNPYLRQRRERTAVGAAEVAAFDRAARDLLLASRPRWVVLVANPASERQGMFASWSSPSTDPALASALAPDLARNAHSHHLSSDRRLRSYRFVQAWRRTPGYWLVLYEKR